MRSAAMVVAALAAGASAWTNETVFYTTEIVTAYTTYCPAATMVTHGSLTYTVTEVRRFPIEVPRSRDREVALSEREREDLIASETRHVTPNPSMGTQS